MIYLLPPVFLFCCCKYPCSAYILGFFGGFSLQKFCQLEKSNSKKFIILGHNVSKLAKTDGTSHEIKRIFLIFRVEKENVHIEELVY